MRKNITLALLSLLSFSFSAYGEQLIFAFDLSPGMGEICPESGSTPLSLAREMALQQIAEAESGSSAIILGFSQKAEIFSEPAGADPAERLSHLQPGEEEASLVVGLKAAHEVSRRQGEERNRIVVYSRGGDDPVRSLVENLGKLSADQVPTELNFFAKETPLGEIVAKRDSLLQIRRYDCAEGARLKRSSILRQVRQIVSRHTGVRVEEIAMDANLADFGADQVQAYEIVTEIHAVFHLLPPAKNNLTSLKDIVEFVAKKVESNQKGTGGEDLDTAPSFAATAGVKEAFFQQKIFYGTNRKRSGNPDPAQFYGGERAPLGKVEYGSCMVTIPAIHKEGSVETPFLGLTFLEDAEQHIRLARVTPLGHNEFFQGVKGSLNSNITAEGWENDTVVFIHGFNVPFEEAAKRTAQMAFDFGFKGAPILFSWPSDGKFYAYLADREDIQWSTQHIEQFLNELAETLLPRRIHLVAHSMGNQGLIGALNLLALRRGAENRPLFENVILAAPDFDAQLFQEQIAPGVQKIAKRWTVYTSDNDAALNISTTINNARRLGLPVTPVPGIDVIDATGIEVTPWSVPEFHSYYATKQTVIQDIVSTLKGSAPSLRNLLPRSEGGIPYWRLGAVGKGK